MMPCNCSDFVTKPVLFWPLPQSAGEATHSHNPPAGPSQGTLTPWSLNRHDAMQLFRLRDKARTFLAPSPVCWGRLGWGRSRGRQTSLTYSEQIPRRSTAPCPLRMSMAVQSSVPVVVQRDVPPNASLVPIASQTLDNHSLRRTSPTWATSITLSCNDSAMRGSSPFVVSRSANSRDPCRSATGVDSGQGRHFATRLTDLTSQGVRTVTSGPVSKGRIEGVQRDTSLWQGVWGMFPQIQDLPRVGGWDRGVCALETCSNWESQPVSCEPLKQPAPSPSRGLLPPFRSS